MKKRKWKWKWKKRTRKLMDLVQHCWVHSGYEDCGYNQMTTEQKELYDDVIGRSKTDFEKYPAAAAAGLITSKVGE